MAIVQEELHARAASLQEYLFTASSDGWGPELIVCDDETQAIRLHNELRVLMHLEEDPLIAAQRHGREVSIWLTDIGHEHMCGMHPVVRESASSEVLFWQPELFN